MNSDIGNIIIQIVILIILTGINAFFSGAEMALVSVNKSRIAILAESGNKKALRIQTLLAEPTKLLSTIQVAITLSSFFASASAATGLSEKLGVTLGTLHIPYAGQISFVLITIILSFFTLVFGELVPKRVALQKSEAFSMISVGVVLWVSKVASPYIKFLTFSTNLTLKMFGMKVENLEEMISREEIQSLVEQGKEQGVFNHIEQEMINSIIEFDNKLAREIMTPRIKVFAVDIAEPRDEYFNELFEMNYSRIPVYEDEIDNVIGVLYIKDLLREAKKVGFDHVDIRKILHEPYMVPDSKNIDELFKEMQHLKIYFAIIINEYGEFSGIVTIEDLVEEVMGDIDDEYVKSSPQITNIDEFTYLLDGMVAIDELNGKFDLAIDSENSDTVSGFVIDQLGYIPTKAEGLQVEFEEYVFEVVSVKEKRIHQLKLHLPQKNQTSETVDL